MASAPAEAQDIAAPGCSDDRGVDRCAPEQHRRVLDLFGMKPIEAHRAGGDQIRRAFYVDGYGRDLLAISFIRAPGRDPTVQVHFRSGTDGRPGKPRSALVPGKVWDEVIERSEHFHRRLQPIAGETGEHMCLHSWVYTVEAHDPESIAGGDAGIRRAVQDACGSGPAALYARALADYALSLLPYCVALGGHGRGSPGQLAACEMLEGDRMAAAEAVKAASEFARATTMQHADARFAFAEGAVLIWPEPPALPGEAGERWIALTRGGSASPFSSASADYSLGMMLDVRRAVGKGWGRVVVEGSLSRSTRGKQEFAVDVTNAPVSLTFERKASGRGFRIARAEVGAFVARGD